MSEHSPIAVPKSQALNAVSGFVWSVATGLHRVWRRRRKPRIAPPILVVGSTRAGGTGKTDLVDWIASRHPGLAVLAHPTGDEEFWLRRKLGERVFVDRDLVRAWGMARRAGYSQAVCDGGMQDPALEDCPALRLELDDSNHRWSDLLPAGRYRERKPRPREAMVHAVWGRDLARSMDPGSLPAPGTEIVAACAIALPEAFFADLETFGLVVVERIASGDHRRFARAAIERAKAAHPDAKWVVTGKDFFREGQVLVEDVFVARRILSISESLADRIDGWVEDQSRKRMDVTPRG